MRPCRTGTRSGSRVASCSSSNAIGSGRSAAGAHPVWLDGGVRLRASLPRARRSSTLGCATLLTAIGSALALTAIGSILPFPSVPLGLHGMTSTRRQHHPDEMKHPLTDALGGRQTSRVCTCRSQTSWRSAHRHAAAHHSREGLMALQSVISLAVLVVVLGRVVNILPSCRLRSALPFLWHGDTPNHRWAPVVGSSGVYSLVMRRWSRRFIPSGDALGRLPPQS